MKTRYSTSSPIVTLTIKDTADDAPIHFAVRKNDKSFHVKTIELVTGASFGGYSGKLKSGRVWISPDEAIRWLSAIDETLGQRVRNRMQRQLGHRVARDLNWEPTKLMMQNHEVLLNNTKNMFQVIYGYQLGHNLVKIGRSDLGVARRIRDLSTRFKGALVFVVPVKNSTMVETGAFEIKAIRNRRTVFTNESHNKTTEVIKLDTDFGLDELLLAVQKAKRIFDNPALNTLY